MNLGPHLILITCSFSSKPLIHFTCQYHTQPVIRNSWIMPNIPHTPLYTYHSSYNHTQPKQIVQEQTDIQSQHCLAQHLAQAEGSRSGEASSLKRTPPSPRRGPERASRNQCGISLRRDPSRLGEMSARSKFERVTWPTLRANWFGWIPVCLA